MKRASLSTGNSHVSGKAGCCVSPRAVCHLCFEEGGGKQKLVLCLDLKIEKPILTSPESHSTARGGRGTSPRALLC